MLNSNEISVIEYLKINTIASSKEIYDATNLQISYATLKRVLIKLSSNNYISTLGQGKGTKYKISDSFNLLFQINIDTYFDKEIDERVIIENYNFELISNILTKFNLFSESETDYLLNLQNKYLNNISQLSDAEYKKELERLAIDLSWKSSQIEGNTYSLLETEILLKEKETASGKTKEEAIMLLNHKDALDFIIENPDYLTPMSISKIEDIHRILVKDLDIDINIRRRRVGISGTNYRPLDNDFQITEALKDMCILINQKDDVFEKSLLALLLLSYIQPFADGNKRTARIVSNSILMANHHCPISFRTVDSLHYKKAMLLFYEQNNISAFKEIFINQFEFAVNTYF